MAATSSPTACCSRRIRRVDAPDDGQMIYRRSDTVANPAWADQPPRAPDLIATRGRQRSLIALPSRGGPRPDTQLRPSPASERHCWPGRRSEDCPLPEALKGASLATGPLSCDFVRAGRDSNPTTDRSVGEWSIAPGSLGHRIGRGEDACHDGERREPVRAQRRPPVAAQVVGGKKTDAVLRLLRGEPLEVLSRELGVEAHRLAAWRDEFLEAGEQGLKGQRADRSQEDRQLKDAERKVGQLTLENEILRAAAEKRGLQIPPAKRPR